MSEKIISWGAWEDIIYHSLSYVKSGADPTAKIKYIITKNRKDKATVTQEIQPTSVDALSCDPNKTNIDITDSKQFKIYSLVEHEAEATDKIK